MGSIHVCICIYKYISLSVYLAIYLSTCLSIYLSIYLPIYLSIYRSIDRSIVFFIYTHGFGATMLSATFFTQDRKLLDFQVVMTTSLADRNATIFIDRTAFGFGSATALLIARSTPYMKLGCACMCMTVWNVDGTVAIQDRSAILALTISTMCNISWAWRRFVRKILAL